jgi:Leucine-rich repeat (LRR) protein
MPAAFISAGSSISGIPQPALRSRTNLVFVVMVIRANSWHSWFFTNPNRMNTTRRTSEISRGNMHLPETSRVPKVRWLVVATIVLIVCGAGLRWWSARGMIREIRRLGGWYALPHSSWVPDAFEIIVAIDAKVDQFTFKGVTIPDHFFDRITNLPNLAHVTLINCTISDSAVDRLREVSTLRDLILDESDVNDATALRLKELRQLTGLRLTATRITDAAMPDLGMLSTLTFLGLSGTAVTDAGLTALSGLPKVRSLDLSHTKITDAGLPQLHGIPLYYLNLQGTTVTAEAVAELQRAIPGCKIIGP